MGFAKPRKMYRIGEVSEKMHLSLRALRYYDQIGILKPDIVDEENGYRYYSEAQLKELSVIKYYQDLGFTLDEIKKILPRNDWSFTKNAFEEKLERIDKDLKEMKKKREALLEWYDLTMEGLAQVKAAKQEDAFQNNIQIKQMPFYQVFCQRQQVKDDLIEADEIINQDIVEKCRKENLYICGPIFLFVDDYNKIITQKINHVDIYAPVAIKAGDPTAGIMKFGGFKVLSAVHAGPRCYIKKTYQKMISWAKANKIELQGTVIEKNLVDSWCTKNEAEHVVEILLPIAARGRIF